MTQQKEWLIVRFTHNESYIEVNMNYQTGSYSLTHGSNDNNVTFTNGVDGGDIQKSFDRAKCVVAALKFIKQELNLQP